MNVKVQCCGLIVLCLCTYFYFRVSKVKCRSQRTFTAFLLTAILCTLSDIASIFAIRFSDSLPAFVVDGVCKLYLVTLLFLMYTGLMYICADIIRSAKSFRKLQRVYVLPIIATSIVMFILPIYHEYRDGGAVVYTYGPATTIAYIAFIAVFMSSIVHLVLDWNGIDKKKQSSVIVWLSLWAMSAAIQYLVPSLLLVSFAADIGVTVMFAMIENPMALHDKDTLFFNTTALRIFLNDAYNDGKPFCMAVTRFDADSQSIYEELPHQYIFIGNGNLYIIFKDQSSLDTAIRRLSYEFETERIYVFRDYDIVSSCAEMMFLLHRMNLLEWATEDNVCLVGRPEIERLDEYVKAQQLINMAIDEDRVELYLQPIYSVREGRFKSAEALVRIRDEDNHIVMPGNFIPIAERDGSIVRLGEIMLEKTCAFLSSTAATEFGLDYVEVNLSVVQGEDRRLALSVMELLERYAITPSRINLEITESFTPRGKKRLLDTMFELKEQGIEFSLDDFGMGHSNLEYIVDMPVKFVKLDRTMLQGYFRSEKTRLVMTTAINMIHEMGLEVVVEGVETKEQFDTVVALGADYVQGFIFSKAIPPEEFLGFIKEKNAVA